MNARSRTNTVKTAGLRVVRAVDRQADTASGAMVREAAISRALVGAERLWVGYVELPAGMASAPHHHGECESAIFIISGEAKFRTGPRYERVETARPGDFVWVPPNVPHIEENASATEPVRMVVARSTQETLVFNLSAQSAHPDPPRGRGRENAARKS